MDTLIDMLNSPAGSFAFILGIMIAIGWVIFYVTKFFTRISMKHEGIEKKAAIIENNIDDIRKDLAYIKGTLDVSVGIKDLLTKKKSPVSLSELGEKMRKENNFDDIIAANWNKILSAIELEKPQNPYDIQEYCIKTSFLEPAKFFTEKNINDLKTAAFKAGLTFMSVARVMGVLIRDVYFKYKNIDIEEVDRYNPK